ncbi:NHL repeat containing protein [Isosphaera pallida ATCC 43644]|uniref:NHL repeat containing protein n=1 Tax=Isosphaera pallida (strain ATCC 43644 / DSM 9630 / IS1B) TaxID=575540 RepID=E8R1C5_ISOPI|nr:thioredoxin-like domain-containing protein [Isosphaera pallida]ADV62342.1 NHL repeat containing protein [Isosphaera pallida ATCC 43644]
MPRDPVVSPPSTPLRPSTTTRRLLGGAALVAALLAAWWFGVANPVWSGASLPSSPVSASAVMSQERVQVDPNAFDGGIAWINTANRIKLSDLRGKIVLIDFWTYCCINCHHVIPDLEYLEKKYPNELVVIGVHTAKFDAERDTENIRRKVAEYRIKHPVVNDADQRIWSYFGVRSWPTLALIDAQGRFVGRASGEGHREALDEVIGKLIEEARKDGTLNETPLVFTPESDKPHDGKLLYPGKVLADAQGGRLFISDTGHNRIVVTNLEGKRLDVIGSGATGFADGSFETASFNRQQGIRLVGETLYVADTENHAIRAANLTTRTVATVAGTGKQTYHRGWGVRGPAKTTGLNSPWDLVKIPDEDRLIIAMAGPHQIWDYDFSKGEIGLWSGTGREDIVDGPANQANYAQPSGIDFGVDDQGPAVYVADSEVSGIRRVDLKTGTASTLIGRGLFVFGDVDGPLAQARLQHCLGVAFDRGVLYVADTYNNKVKQLDLKARTIITLVGDGQPGDGEEPGRLYEPGGVSVAGDMLYIADTNHHRVVAFDLKSRQARALTLEGVEPPARLRVKPTFALAKTLDAADTPAPLTPGGSLRFQVTLPLPEGMEFGPDTAIQYLIESINQPKLETFGEVRPPAETVAFDLTLPTDFVAPAEGLRLVVSVGAFVCQKSQGFCQPRSRIFNVRLIPNAEAPAVVELQAD